MIKKIFVSEIPIAKGLGIEKSIEEFARKQECATLVAQEDNEKMMLYPRLGTVAELIELLNILPDGFGVSVMGNENIALAIDYINKLIVIDNYNYILNNASLFLSDDFNSEEDTFESLEELSSQIRYSFSIKCCSNRNEIVLLRSNTVAEVRRILKQYSQAYGFLCSGSLRYQVLIDAEKSFVIIDEPNELSYFYENDNDDLNEKYYLDDFVGCTQESAVYRNLYTTINYENTNTFFIFKSYLSALNYLKSLRNEPDDNLCKLIKEVQPTYINFDADTSTSTFEILNSNRIYYYDPGNRGYPYLFANYKDCAEHWQDSHGIYNSYEEMEADIYFSEFKNGRFEIISRCLMGE